MSHERHETKIKTSDELHNHNCYLYLKNLAIAHLSLHLDKIDPELIPIIETIKRLGEYNETYAYGELYNEFFKVSEAHSQSFVKLKYKLSQLKEQALSNIELIERMPHGPTRQDLLSQAEERLEHAQMQIEGLDQFILSIYDNNNKVLDETHDVIKEIPKDTKIAHGLKDPKKEKRINRKTLSPNDAGSNGELFKAMMASNFKPQYSTSIATRRTYEHHEGFNGAIELRFGTQAQRHNGKPRVSPLFGLYLSTLNEQEQISHVYFNNLGLDRKRKITDPFNEGRKERDLSKALHDLENYHSNIAVITLPADKELMSHGKVLQTSKTLQYEDVLQDFLKIVKEDDNDKSARSTKDFHISPTIRKKLFGSPEAAEQKLTELLEESFKALGFDKDSKLSKSDRQAVWFHFNKYVFPQFILDKLQPQHFNFSCKDAIDRGGVSSAYYNLMQSIQLGKPMSRDEFEKALHAAPAMVKGRRMNHHVELIWNTLNRYIASNYHSISQNEKLNWLLDWDKDNCPRKRQKTQSPTTIHELASLLKAGNIDENTFNTSLQGITKNMTEKELKQNTALLWDALHFYLKKNDGQIKDDGQKQWMYAWRRENCPHDQIRTLLPTFIQEAKDILNDARQEERHPLNQRIDKGIKILETIDVAQQKHLSNRDTLLKAVIQTPDVFLKPNKENIKAYEATASSLIKEGFKSIGYKIKDVFSSFFKHVNQDACKNMKEAMKTLREEKKSPQELNEVDRQQPPLVSSN
ncbi:MAG: hypothetical protein LCH30_06465 [Proteobacteria bacterium]|nr:hypothetical protein [Pseudomonadota bacterium]